MPSASVRSRAVAVAELVRWPNAVMAVAGVLLGAWWVRRELFVSRDLLLAIGAACCATAAVNALNDAFDIEIDRVAHPERPLPRGELTPRAALVIGTGATIAAYALAQSASTQVGLIVLGALAAAYLYAMHLARRGLFGNLLVAIVASLPFLVGGAAAGDAGDALALFGVAVPMHFAREVMKDVADAPGDRGHRQTVALAWGERPARALALASVLAYAALAATLLAPAGAARLALLPSVAVAAWAALRTSAARAPAQLKLSMLLAMAALPLLR